MHDCGISIIPSKLNLEDKTVIIEATVKHYCIFACKAELDEILLGLETFQLTKIFKNHQEAFLPLLTFVQPAIKTASSVETIFTPQFSPQGSTRRALEEETLFFWISILEEIEYQAGDIGISFEDILIYTGALTIQFDDGIKFPLASTCSNVLMLPLNQAYGEFKDNLTFGIRNSHGFMRI